MVALLTRSGATDDRLFAASWDGHAVRIVWSGSGRHRLARSTDTPAEQALHACPVTALNVVANECLDEHAASGVTYYYTLSGEGDPTRTLAVEIPEQDLPESKRPDVLIDKRNFVLEVWDGQRMLKRYPMTMGSNPVRRKLQQDKASTPEGRYRITATQPNARFYRAYDIDYPNATDKARYKLLAPKAPIGGEIQVHGQGIDTNWTWGCVALRNDDMDELFEHPEIGVDSLVWIFGGELSQADLESDERASLADSGSPYSPIEIGKMQDAADLKVTCVWDVATRARFGDR